MLLRCGSQLLHVLHKLDVFEIEKNQLLGSIATIHVLWNITICYLYFCIRLCTVLQGKLVS